MSRPSTGEAFDKHAGYSNRVVEVSQDLGLNILGTLGDTGEYHVEHVILSPPYIVKAEEVLEIVRLLKMAIQLVDQEYKSVTQLPEKEIRPSL